MTKIRWGVLSTAKIAIEKVIPAMQDCELGHVVAIASRDAERARQAAARLHIPTAHASYEALLADETVDAIYNPLPNHLHVDWSIRALEAGKHVLCEKPVGLDAADAQRLLAASRSHPHLKVMEAFMYRLHPQWVGVKRLVDDGAIGTLRSIQSLFSYYNADPDNIRNQIATGGGALMDIGCYCISLSRWLFDHEPQRVLGWSDIDSTFGTDVLTSGVLEFDSGVSSFTCSTQLAPHQRVEILGTGGRIEIEIPFNAPPEEPCIVNVWRDGILEILSFGPVNQYTLQGDAFARSVVEGRVVPTPLADAIANMRVIDALRAAATKGSHSASPRRLP
jgi:predicted dehydrogenase